MVIDVHQSGVLLIALLAKILNLWHEKTCDMRQLGRSFKTQNLLSGRVSFMKIQPFVNDVARIFPLKISQHVDFLLPGQTIRVV